MGNMHIQTEAPEPNWCPVTSNATAIWYQA